MQHSTRTWFAVLMFVCFIVIFAYMYTITVVSKEPLQNSRNNWIGGNKSVASDRKYLIGENVPDTDDRKVLIDGDLCKEYSLNGTVFQNSKTILQESRVKMCHLKTFEKGLVENMQKEFIDFNNNIKVRLKAPSLMWFEGHLVLTLRIHIVRRPGSWADCYGLPCCFIYYRKYDIYLNPIGPREIITVLSPFEMKRRSGVDDTRLFQMNGSLYSVFATGYAAYNAKSTVTHLISGIWDHQLRKHFIPDFQKELLSKKTLEKNWVPMVINEELHIIRHLDPLHILKCKIHENCEFVKNDTDVFKFEMIPEESPLRGGTAFELYKYPYYIGLQHGTYHKDDGKFYAAYVVILCVDPFRIVYVSDPLQAHSNVLEKFTEDRIYSDMLGKFIFPTGILFENHDSVVIGATVNDEGSVLLRMEGIQELVSKVIELDKDKTYQNPPFSVQNYLLGRAKLLNITGDSYFDIV